MLRFSARGSLCRGVRCDPPPVRGWRAATRPPHHPRHQEIPAAACQPPAGDRIKSTECIDRGWLRVACCKVLMSVVARTADVVRRDRQVTKARFPNEPPCSAINLEFLRRGSNG